MIDLKYIKLPTIFSWSVCDVWVTLGLKNQDNLSFYLHFFYLKYKRSIFYNNFCNIWENLMMIQLVLLYKINIEHIK